jgi:small GTP-binding protein
VKIIILGDAGVGKTSLLHRFIGHQFPRNTRSTILVDYFVLNLDIDDDQFSVQLFDTSGQEKFNAITRSFYRKADGAILVYSERKQKSFDSLQRHWLGDLKSNGFQVKQLLVVGNQMDLLREEKKPVDEERIKDLVRGFESDSVRLSAKTDTGQRMQAVIESFCKRVIVRKYQLGGPEKRSSSDSIDDETIHISESSMANLEQGSE